MATYTLKVTNDKTGKDVVIAGLVSPSDDQVAEFVTSRFYFDLSSLPLEVTEDHVTFGTDPRTNGQSQA